LRSWFRVGLRLGVLAGAVFAVVLAARSRRNATQPGAGPGRAGPGGADPDGTGRATGVHGQWPDVRRAEAPVEGDHHPHGRVTVPREAAPLGAPPAVATDPPGPTDPEVPEPQEHLDEETRPAPAARTPVAPASAPAPAKRPAERRPAGRSASRSATKKAPAKKAPAKAEGGSQAGAPWVAPEGRECPPTHPVKAKLASKLFHLPGMLAYDRTVPDRCYVDAAAAEADGFQRAKR
jgi:outer membrane biosynthesis protein TonB